MPGYLSTRAIAQVPAALSYVNTQISTVNQTITTNTATLQDQIDDLDLQLGT